MTPFNDWPIRKCLISSAIVLAGMLALTTLAAFGIDIPVLRQVVAFIFVTLVPGVLILRILKIHNISFIEGLVYSAGLSLAFTMFMGAFINLTLPHIGISQPISTIPVTIALSMGMLILMAVACWRDRDYVPENKTNRAKLSLPALLTLVLVLVLTILGACLINTFQNNIILITCLLGMAAIVGFIAFGKFIDSSLYPVAVFVISLGLLYQTTMISDYLVGSDIHLEYYLSNLVLSSGHWDASIPIPLNSCISVVILAPVYALLLNMDIVWLFKIIYPLLFSLVPLALFCVFRLQIKPYHAFLAAFFFISMPMFFMDMAQLVRQQISELFFVLVILLLVGRKLALAQRTTLVLIFSLGIAVSYYGMGVGYIVYLGVGALVLIVIKSHLGQTIWQRIIGRSKDLPSDLTCTGALTKRNLAIVIGGYLIFTTAFYAVTASGTNLPYLKLLIDIPKLAGHQIAQSMQPPPAGEILPLVELPSFIQSISARFAFLNPLTKESLVQTALGLDFAIASTAGKAWRIFQYVIELCLVIGFVRFIFRPTAHRFQFKAEYIALVIVSALALLGIFLFPAYAGHPYGMGTSRVWQITLLLMSPLVILGGAVIGYGVVKLARTLGRKVNFPIVNPDSPLPLRIIVAAVLIPYFIFNSGIVFELSQSQTTHCIDIPYSIALSSYRVDVNTVFVDQDIAAADWISKVAEENLPVFVDYHSGKLLGYGIDPASWHQLESLGMAKIGFPSQVHTTHPDTQTLPKLAYIYLRSRNTQEKELTFGTGYGARQSISFDDLPWLTEALWRSNSIYDNGSARVLFTPQGEEQ